MVRDVARADAAVARIVDGHLNAVERLAVHAEDPLRERELTAVAEERLRLGVWGADPRPGEGEPARIRDGGLHGVKTFCSGAGGLQRAIVLAGDRLAYVDLTEGTLVDPAWFAGAGMRASVSHRVVFDGAPVLAVLGAPGAIAQEPWFVRDAVRTAATWAGAADAAADEAVRLLATRPEPTELERLAAGRIRAEQGTIGLWLAEGGRRGDAGTLRREDGAYLRHVIAAATSRLLDEAARACGSHPFTTGGGLDRARRDLELFTLQHRLDPSSRAPAQPRWRRPGERRSGDVRADVPRGRGSVGLRDLRLRGARSTTGRSRRWATGASTVPSSWAARSGC